MHIFRWLLVHPVIFAWILAFAAILLNWGVGGKAPEGGHEQQAAAEVAEHSQVAEATEAPAAEQAAATEAPAAEQAAATEAPAAEQAAATEAPAAEQAAATEAPAAEQAAVTEAVTEQAQGLAAAGAVAAVASTSITEQAATVAGEAATAVATAEEQTNAGEASADDLLRAAREAYWAGEYDRSVEFYQSLLAKDEPAYKGELANVYWKQGNSTEAVSLYASIAGWLAEQGRTAELNSIKVYADLVDPAKAAEIGALLK